MKCSDLGDVLVDVNAVRLDMLGDVVLAVAVKHEVRMFEVVLTNVDAVKLDVLGDSVHELIDADVVQDVDVHADVVQDVDVLKEVLSDVGVV
eukprot:3155570-Amphidinium_carterae.1